MSHLRHPLSKVRGLGSAKSGTAHFIAERVSALALIPLCIWFVTNLVTLAMSGDALALTLWVKSPFTALLMLLFIACVFWHSRLGVQVIIEDYVHKPFSRNFLLLLSSALHVGLAILCLMAIFQLHFLSEAAV